MFCGERFRTLGLPAPEILSRWCHVVAHGDTVHDFRADPIVFVAKARSGVCTDDVSVTPRRSSSGARRPASPCGFPCPGRTGRRASRSRPRAGRRPSAISRSLPAPRAAPGRRSVGLVGAAVQQVLALEVDLGDGGVARVLGVGQRRRPAGVLLEDLLELPLEPSVGTTPSNASVGDSSGPSSGSGTYRPPNSPDWRSPPSDTARPCRVTDNTVRERWRPLGSRRRRSIVRITRTAGF